MADKLRSILRDEERRIEGARAILAAWRTASELQRRIARSTILATGSLRDREALEAMDREATR
jgi:hypothetical protein